MAGKKEVLQPFIEVGARVVAMGKFGGVIRFVGTTSFAEGIWVGVELDNADGKNDGSVQKVQYFTCESKKGIFCRPSVLEKPAGQSTKPTSDRLAYRRRSSVDSQLTANIVPKGQSDVTQAIGACLGEVSQLEETMARLTLAMDNALVREAAARAAIAAATSPAGGRQPAEGRAPPFRFEESAGDEPTQEQLEEWLRVTSAKLSGRLEEHIQHTIEDELMRMLIAPLGVMQSATADVREA